MLQRRLYKKHGNRLGGGTRLRRSCQSAKTHRHRQIFRRTDAHLRRTGRGVGSLSFPFAPRGFFASDAQYISFPARERIVCSGYGLSLRPAALIVALTCVLKRSILKRQFPSTYRKSPASGRLFYKKHANKIPRRRTACFFGSGGIERRQVAAKACLCDRITAYPHSQVYAYRRASKLWQT